MESYFQGGSWMFLLLIMGSLSTMSCAQRTASTCGRSEEELCSFYFNRLENAFTSDQNIVYTLQKVFFPVGRLAPSRVDVNTEIRFDNVPNISCSNAMFTARNRDIFSLRNNTSVLCAMYGCISSAPYRFEHRWIRSIVNFVIESEALVFLESVNFVAYAASFFNHIDFSRENIEFPENISSVDLTDSEVQFNLRVPNLPCIPEVSAVLDAWEDILPWLQQYARNRREGIDEFDEDDRGYPVQIGDTAEIDNSNDLGTGLILTVLTVVHILVMIVTALIIMWVMITYYKETFDPKKLKPAAVSLYWSNVLMSSVAASVILFGNISLYDVEDGIAFLLESSPRVFAFRIASDATTVILVFLELVAAWHAHSAKNKAKTCIWVIQIAALWVQMILLQLAAASLLPVVIVCLRNPTPSIAFATLMAAIYFFLVIFIAYFIQIVRDLSDKDRQRKRESSKILSVLLQAFAFLVFLGIVACIVAVYLRFVQAGGGSSSIAGVALSLIPTIGLSAVAGFAKRHLLAEEKGEEDQKDKEKDDGQTRSDSNGRIAATQLPMDLYVKNHNSPEDTGKVSLDLEPSETVSNL